MRVLLSLILLSSAAFPATALAQSWARRWRHAETRVGPEPDLAAAVVVLFGDLVLFTEPYVPSHCGEAIATSEGRVIALDRTSGATRWVRTIRQSTGDQAAYLRAHVTAELVVFESWGGLRAFDREGRIVWQRDALAAACAGGPTQGPFDELRRRGSSLYWSDGARTCALDLRTGGTSDRGAAHLPPERPTPSCAASSGGEGPPWRLGSACDGEARFWAEVDAEGAVRLRGAATRPSH